MRIPLGSLATLVCVGISSTAIAQTQTDLKFQFAPGKVAPGYTQVAADTAYNADQGYGFEPGSKVKSVDEGGDDPLHAGFVTSDKPFYFSIKLPEGNYNVTLTLGDAKGTSDTTVKAELRRLMLQGVRTASGQIVTRTIVVNLRQPKISTGGSVSLKGREETTEAWAWDDKMELEFNGPHPAVDAIEISKADVPTIYILGDSTVCDQPAEPWNSWGQMLPRFFKPGIAVANHAESGETLRSSLGAKRLAKVLSLIKPGDYLFIQFGHNDMKAGAREPATGAYTDYLKEFAEGAKAKGATPVLITPVNRKQMKDGKVVNTLQGYPDAVRQAAKDWNMPLIDLNAMSKTLYEAIGPENIGKAFQDGTHHNNYGSYELAQCIIDGIRQDHLPIEKFIVDDVPPFDPAHPDPIASVIIPPSAMHSAEKPAGS